MLDWEHYGGTLVIMGPLRLSPTLPDMILKMWRDCRILVKRQIIFPHLTRRSYTMRSGWRYGDPSLRFGGTGNESKSRFIPCTVDALAWCKIAMSSCKT